MATPALIFPPDGDKNRRSVILGVCWTECAVAMIVVLLRVLSRLMIRGLGVDDWAMFLTMVGSNMKYLPIPQSSGLRTYD